MYKNQQSRPFPYYMLITAFYIFCALQYKLFNLEMGKKTFCAFLSKLKDAQQLILWSERIKIDVVAG